MRTYTTEKDECQTAGLDQEGSARNARTAWSQQGAEDFLAPHAREGIRDKILR